MARTVTMTPKVMMRLMMMILACFHVFLPQSSVQGSTDTCVPGHDTDNLGGSCNFGTPLSFTLCDWKSMEGDNRTWINFFNDLNKSPCVMTDSKSLTMNQIVRLTSPLLCATNSTFHSYSLHFLYYMYDSLRCRLSLSVYSSGGKKLAELWNTQQSTVDPRSEDWTSQTIDIVNADSSFYLIFAIERKSSSETTPVALDSLRYTATPITTTTITTPATTSNLTSTLPPSPPTTTPTPPTTTTPATTAATTVSTMRVSLSTSAVGTAPDDSLILGLSRDVVIAIGVAIVVVIVLILVIAIICRRVRREEEVKTVSFALASPTAYNVNEEKKSTGKRRREMKARASVLVPSKHSNWEPDRSLY